VKWRSTLRTEARIGYDANNLYVLVRSFDPRPDSVLAVLQRRDNFLLSDDVVIGIDSYNDKRTGYLFRLTPAGSMAEGYMFNDGEEDWGWNAVWQGAAKVDSLGWVASTAFRSASSATWRHNTFGIAIIRRTVRSGERVVAAYPSFQDGYGQPVGCDAGLSEIVGTTPSGADAVQCRQVRLQAAW
jgi:hypothetical protein